MKLKTIVSVLDSLSAATNAALSRALSLAQWYESDLHVVHVPPSSRVSDGVGNAIHDDIAERITAVAEASGTDGVNVIPAVLSGSPVRAIADYTNRVSADLVVVGKKARRGSGSYRSAGSFGAWEEFVAGSTVHTVLRRTASPVLLVPGPATMSLVRPADQDDVHVATHAGTFGLSAGIEPDRARKGGLSWQ